MGETQQKVDNHIKPHFNSKLFLIGYLYKHRITDELRKTNYKSCSICL